MDRTLLLAIFLSCDAALFLALAIVNRRLATAMFCALLPTYLFRFDVPLPPTALRVPTTFLEILFLLLFAAWIGQRGWRDLPKGALDRWIGPAMLLLLGATIGMLVAPDLRPAAGLWRAYFAEPMLFFVLFVSTVKTAGERVLILYAFAASLAVIGLSAVFQKFTGFGIPNPIWQAEATRRVTSFYGFPNAIGLFGAPIVILMTAWTLGLLRMRKTAVRLLGTLTFAVAALGALGILFAVSEGAIIGTLAGLLALGLLRKELRAATLVAVILACAVTIFWAPARDYASLVASLRDDSGTVRRIVWTESLDMLADRPIFGAGLSGYRETLAPYHQAKHIEIFMYPHDLFLNFWTETGVIGLAGFLWLIAAFFAALIPSLGARGSLLSSALIAAMVAVLVHGLVDVPYLKNDLAFLFWALCGLAASIAAERAARPSGPPPKPKDPFHIYTLGE